MAGLGHAALIPCADLMSAPCGLTFPFLVCGLRPRLPSRPTLRISCGCGQRAPLLPCFARAGRATPLPSPEGEQFGCMRNRRKKKKRNETRVGQKVTDKIVASLEKGELRWLKSWSAGNIDGRVLKPLRHNGVVYSGINALMLWAASMGQGMAPCSG